MRILRFPISFLIFMAPAISVLEVASLRLQLLAASFSALLLGLVGMPVILDGLTVHVGDFSLTVEMPCSGLSSLLSMSALAFLYVYLVNEHNANNEIKFRRVKQIVVLLSMFPIVLLANSLRIAVVAVIGHHYGEGSAMGFFHFGSSLMIFAVSLSLLISVGHVFGLHGMPFGHQGIERCKKCGDIGA